MEQQSAIKLILSAKLSIIVIVQSYVDLPQKER